MTNTRTLTLTSWFGLLHLAEEERSYIKALTVIHRRVTHWLVDPEDVGAVSQGLVRPEVCHGLGFHPRALLPLQHAGARRAIQGVDLREATGKTQSPMLMR